MNFETYLISKKIDSAAFSAAEPELWKTWNYEFESMHPNSFTAQKLYLINPVRRKYPLKPEAVRPNEPNEASIPDTALKPSSPDTSSPGPKPPSIKPSFPKPVFKPKPKIS